MTNEAFHPDFTHLPAIAQDAARYFCPGLGTTPKHLAPRKSQKIETIFDALRAQACNLHVQLSLSTGTQFESHQPQVHQTKTVKSISPTRRQPQKKAEGSPGEHRLELCNLEKEQTGEDRPPVACKTPPSASAKARLPEYRPARKSLPKSQSPPIFPPLRAP